MRPGIGPHARLKALVLLTLPSYLFIYSICYDETSTVAGSSEFMRLMIFGSLGLAELCGMLAAMLVAWAWVRRFRDAKRSGLPTAEILMTGIALAPLGIWLIVKAALRLPPRA